jgi:hypothetical protein
VAVSEPGDYVIRNRRQWDRWARDYEEPGRQRWSEKEPFWGEWGVPEAQLELLPSDVSGWDVIELGCGCRVCLGVACQARRATCGD